MMMKKPVLLLPLLVLQPLQLRFLLVLTFTTTWISSVVTVNAEKENETCVTGRGDGKCPEAVEFNEGLDQDGEGDMVHKDEDDEQHGDYNDDGEEEEDDDDDDDYVCGDELEVEKCRELAKDLGCIRNFASMRDDCTRTCSLCDNVFDKTSDGFHVKNMYSKVPQKILFRVAKNDHQEDKDESEEAEEEDFVDPRERLIKVDKYMYYTVYEKSEYERHRSSCRNELEECILEAANGACEENTQYMLQHCRPSCFACQREEVHASTAGYNFGYNDDDGVGSGMSSKGRGNGRDRQPNQFQQKQQQQQQDCPLPNDPQEGIVWQPGTSHHMFRRIVKDNSSRGSSSVTIYSQPRSIKPIKPIADANEPWIVAIDDFLTPEQCDSLIELGEQTPFTSASSSSSRRVRRSSSDDSDKDEAFKTALCLSDHCREHLIMVQVLEKVREVTGIPMENYEHLQFRKYNGTTATLPQEGEVDRDDNANAKDVLILQHDYEPYHFTRFQGPRILTVFLYLNDVPENENGKVGELEFPNLDVTVAPKKGRAVIWPNVYDAHPLARDLRTEHHLFPVEQQGGIQYVAKLWIHQRDFQTTFAKDCA